GAVEAECGTLAQQFESNDLQIFGECLRLMNQLVDPMQIIQLHRPNESEKRLPAKWWPEPLGVTHKFNPLKQKAIGNRQNNPGVSSSIRPIRSLYHKEYSVAQDGAFAAPAEPR
ncbi:MAG TPA: hypothetical protein VGD54_02675, partial [Steroidobacteraceae bacterium]